jgi:glycosyltransferase involved in cell wall biosynthesis
VDEVTHLRDTRKTQVAVIYHFFAHYRSAIMQMLLDCKENDYFLVGDRSDPDNSIKAWHPPVDKLLFAPCAKITSTLLWQKGLIRLALRRDIDVMIFLGNANFLSTWVAAFMSRLTRKRVLFWTHGWNRDEGGLKARIRMSFYRLADGLLLYGRQAKQIGVRNGFTAETLYVVYNSMDYQTQKMMRTRVTLERLNHTRAELFPDSDAPLLICTGRLTKSKGFGLLLEAMSLLQKQGFKTSLLLIGEGPEGQFLLERARELHLAVNFYGACYDEARLAELIMSANVTVSPGQIGLTVMHSLAYGTPVVTHNDPDEQGPEWEAVAAGHTGDFFRRGDVQDLAKAIHKWCVRPWPDECVRQQCIEVIDKFYNPQFQRQAIGRAVAGLPAE